MSTFTPAFQLSTGVQSYEWGKIGSDSKAAQFGKTTKGFKIEEGKPYAELWMGTHPSCPSSRAETSELLSKIIASDPKAYLGPKVQERFGDDLPFLFKVLAIGKALSIQAHPNKQLAEQLHKDRPDVYKDDNHKPEMAIAITPFKAFVGFRPLAEIASFLSVVPEFSDLISSQAKTTFIACAGQTSLPLSHDPSKVALREVFESLMTADEAEVKTQLAKLVNRYEVGGVEVNEEVETKELRELVRSLNEQFPDDIGVFCSFLLNVVSLEPGGGAFLKADEPHAYISGDIVECMATSDNVVRAGLTPKLRDVPTLVSMLTYYSAPPDAQLMNPDQFKSLAHTKLYDPPIDEFSVAHTHLPSGEKEKQPAVDGPSILLITEGTGKLICGEVESELETGAVWFIAAGQELELSANGALQAYRAFVEAN
ncbi:Mannose-6-phosphate isomerase [Phaffia rhodozyma]|uniref:Mannose-6-phosphate isomerase n=1 Tax=Phaffia rhodozyma TaxID=264483 RepID=A0A0F7SFH5_PHARH|nr:Mannose-6-phosphate isomerase [Phaffia rhodozyma]